MFEHINWIIGGFRETKSKMWEYRSKVDLTANSDHCLEPFSSLGPLESRNDLNYYVTYVKEKDNPFKLNNVN